MAAVGTLSMNLVANSSAFTAGVNSAARTVDAFQGKVRSVTGSIGGQLAGMFGAAGSAGFVGWGVKLAADAETAQASFSVLAGSGERARQMLAEIKQFADASPLSGATLRDSAVTMMSFGVAGESILPTLRQLGDLSLGNGERLKSMALAFGQVTAAGRLMGQDVLQFINAGFNPLQEISKRTGESMVELKTRMEAGGVSSREVAEALRSATAAGGQFHGMMEAQAGTTAGKFAMLQDQAATLAQTLGAALVPGLNAVMDAVSPVVLGLASMDESTRSNIVQFGALGLAITAGAGAVVYIGKTVVSLVAGMKALATSQAIVQALSGPKGWLALGAGVAIAAGAVAGVSAMFDQATESAKATGEEANRAAAQVAKIQAPAAGPDIAKAFDAQKFADAAANDQAAKLKSLLDRGSEIAKQFRTPGEVFADTSAELNQLLSIGAISAQTYQRAIAGARKDMGDALADQMRIDEMRRGIGAATAGTREGFSAVQEALRNADAQRAKEQAIARQAGAEPAKAVAVAERQLEEQRRSTEWLERIDAGLANLPGVGAVPITFQVAEF